MEGWKVGVLGEQPRAVARILILAPINADLETSSGTSGVGDGRLPSPKIGPPTRRRPWAALNLVTGDDVLQLPVGAAGQFNVSCQTV